jgi:hypothetical protein
MIYFALSMWIRNKCLCDYPMDLRQDLTPIFAEINRQIPATIGTWA